MATEREAALWRQQESFGWSIAPDVSFDWTREMLQERQAQDQTKKQRPTTAPPKRRVRPSSAKWTSRLLKIPTSTKRRGMPKGVRRPRPTRGTSVRFLSTRRDTVKNDSRFLPQYSPYYTSTPYDVQAPQPTKEVREPVPPPSGGETLPASSKEWLTLQSVTMHGGARSRGLSSTLNRKVASPLGLSPPKPSSRSMDIDLSSATSRMTHARMLGRRLSFRLTYPKQIMSNIRGDLHVMMKKHHFVPVPPKNWPEKKQIGRREGCRVVVEWHGATKDVWELLRELNLVFNHLLLVSCEDFYILERAHMFCRTFQEESMPVAQRHKIIQLTIVKGAGHALAVEESPLARAERERKFMIKFNALEKLRVQAEERQAQREFMRGIRARAEMFKGPTKSPMESLSKHKRTVHADFGGGPKSAANARERNEKNGPGSFVTPLAMGKQLETRKRNVVNVVSLTSIAQRDSPEKHVPEGMRVGVGPAYYEIARTMDSGPAIKLGPGFTSGKETPEHIVCKKLYSKWSKIDNQLSKEQQIVEKEMRRIRRREEEVMIMARGLRKITASRKR